MPEEQNQAPVEAPQQAAAGAAPAEGQASKESVKTKGGNKGCTVAIIIVGVIIIFLAVGSYFAYRYVKSKININHDSTTLNVGDSTISGSNTGNTYSTVTEQTLTQDLAKTVDSDLNPILSKLFGDVKIKDWAAYQSDSGSIGYITKNTVTNELIATVQTELSTAGYTDISNMSQQSGGVFSGVKNDNYVVIYLDSSENPNDITVTFNKQSATSDSAASE